MGPETIGRCALASAGVLLTACGPGPGSEWSGDPLVIEPVADPPEIDQPLDLGIALDESGFFSFTAWPSACDLVSDVEIEAVLPQVAAIDRSPEEVDIILFGAGRTVTVAEAECRVALDIPDAGMHPDGGTAAITFSIEAAGSPDVVERNFRPRSDIQVEVPEGECFAIDGGFQRLACRRDSLAFEITASFGHQNLSGGTWTDSYVVDGETTTFTDEGADDGPEAFLEAERFLRDTLGIELAKIVLAKVDR